MSLLCPSTHLISDIPQCAPCKWDDGLNLKSRHFKGSAVGMKAKTGRLQYPFALSLSKGLRAGHQGALGPQGDRERARSPNGAWSLPGRCINALKCLHLRR
jgi:hypothetical protein